MNSVQEKVSRLKKNIEKVIFGKSEAIGFAITCLLAKGHLLIEDVPGVGKTSLAHCLANSLHLDFKRIQFTNDLLPADITGVSIYDQGEKRFHFQKGQDEQGLPFVGRAGKKLTEIIEKGMGLNREKDTYICNIVKCRPPGNRDPEPDEIAACKPFLIQQLKAIKPKVIVALGKPASSTLLGRNVPIVKERGTWHEYEGIKLMLTFHPAYLIRFPTLENRRAVHDDVKKVLKELKESQR